MERTQRLHMTEEDREKQARKEFSEAVLRLVSKRLEGQISIDRFREELNRLGEIDADRKAIVVAEMSKRIDPLADDSPLLDLMENGLGLDISGITATLENFAERLHCEEDLAGERLRTALLNKGISGDAVIPNVEADRDWQEKRTEMIGTVKEKLAADSARL